MHARVAVWSLGTIIACT